MAFDEFVFTYSFVRQCVAHEFPRTRVFSNASRMKFVSTYSTIHQCVAIYKSLFQPISVGTQSPSGTMLNTKKTGTDRESGGTSIAAREALRRFQFAGIEVIPHPGEASNSSIDEVLDVYATRGLLEEQAARLAARNIGPSESKALEQLATSMETAVTKRNWDGVIDSNRKLHFVIYEVAKRPHLLRLIEQSWKLCERHASLLPCASIEKSRGALVVIRSIVAACKLKDASAMGTLIRYENHQIAAAVLEHEASTRTAVATRSSRKQSGLRVATRA
jgi:DNA-binding GntR family transcriptional regulator